MNRIIALMALLYVSFGSLSAKGLLEYNVNRTHERTKDSVHTFYFDDKYFLSDEDCAFWSISRTATFNPFTKLFEGSFKDYNRDGNLILEGNYSSDGKKEGDFTAFHPNGGMKWKGTYANNLPYGLWKYYYPDGKPMLAVEYQDSTMRIKTQWDNNGKRTVRNGNGIYEFVNPFPEFHPDFLTYYKIRGRLINGELNKRYSSVSGGWRIFIYDNVYPSDGIILDRNAFIDSNNEQDWYYFAQTNVLPVVFEVLPKEYYQNAELLIHRPCDFDYQSGFVYWLTERINKGKKFEPVPNEEQVHFELTMRVSQYGQISRVFFQRDLNGKIRSAIYGAFSKLEFFLPSYDQDSYQSDVITLIGRAHTRSGILNYIEIVDIQRKIEDADLKK